MTWPEPAPQGPAPQPVIVEPRRPQLGRWIVLTLLALGALTLWWVQTHRQTPAVATFAPARMATARSGAIERTIRVTGSTAASRSKYLIAPRMGGTRSFRDQGELGLTLMRLLPAGSNVKKGQIVAEFDRHAMMLRLDDYRSSVLQEKSSLVRLQAYLELRRVQQRHKVAQAKAAMEKAALDLRTAPVRSDMTIERYKMNQDEAKARYAQYQVETPWVDQSERSANRRYEIEVIQAEAELAKAQKNLDEMVFRAPMDGVLLLMHNRRGGEFTEIREGDIIGPGQTFGQIVDSQNLVVEAALNQADLEQVRSGYRARVHLDAHPQLELPARVVAIGTVPRSGQRPAYRQDVPLRLELEKSDPMVVPNLTASADVIVEADEDAVIVPRECVFLDKEQKPFALVETPGGWERRGIELGIANHVEVAVQSGIKEGERLAAELPAPSAPAN
jgi:HlyD family secretion protein